MMESMKKSTPRHIDPVTLVLSWHVKPGKDEAFQEWMHTVHMAAIKWPGHLGVTTLRPVAGSHDYQTILRFDTAKHLNAWLNSSERKALLKNVKDLATEEDREATGLETWFDIPGTVTPPPPRWKMVIVTFVAIYPIAILFGYVVNPRTITWPVPLRAICLSVAAPILLTYLIMPWLTRKIFKRWLYKTS
jgi:antibiotic biosynthesis monooxygenase (ABM) superfamily enzyme